MTRALSHQKVKASPFLEVNHDPNLYCVEFPGGSAGSGSVLVTAVFVVTAVAQVRSLAQEISHAAGTVQKKKKKEKKDCIIFFFFLGPPLQHMEVPRP